MNWPSVLTLAVLALRATCVLAVMLTVLFAARRSSATLRRYVLLLGLGATLVLPLFAVPFPGRPVLHVNTGAVTARVLAEALAGPNAAASVSLAPPSSFVAPARRVPVAAWLVLAWGLGALVVAARTGVGVLQAKKLVGGAQQAHAGARIHAALEGPVVVGLFRPVILLPPAALSWSAAPS